MLIVDSAARIKPIDALAHEFFQTIAAPVTTKFHGRRKFKVSFTVSKGSPTLPLTFVLILFVSFLSPQSAYRAILFIRILKDLKACGTTLSLYKLTTDPYSNKRLRKLIDALAFDVYSHWIKRGDEQNRAALYENKPRCEQVQMTLTPPLQLHPDMLNAVEFNDDAFYEPSGVRG
ncbi:unnamed protein product [Hydatigera taeniaeformis]|uniref:Uncharacterized protein n=1 Tax=Hydatigena taeniaeformis TaxID=6205 RepID=A0A0R3WRQ3_HYDTA|nr:unnamed protein product [Hydatigera taeniaeformis]